MKRRLKNHLRRELIKAGAKPGELNQLLAVSGGLNAMRAKPNHKAHNLYQLVPIGAGLLIALLFGMTLVSVAQSSLPGSRLYSVKKASENIAMDVHPSYRGVVMMQRAQEVEKLVAENANPNLVKATLADYQKQADAYKYSGARYSVYEFCKTNLKQAATQANGPEKQAINQTLASLSDV